MPHVNTVTLWLIDGKVEGRIQATLDNWHSMMNWNI